MSSASPTTTTSSSAENTNMIPTAPTRRPIGFLDLPPELREIIYDLAFPFNTVKTFSCSTDRFLDNKSNIQDPGKLFPYRKVPQHLHDILLPAEQRKVKTPKARRSSVCRRCHENPAAWSLCYKCQNSAAGLLLTCRTVYLEAIPYAYQNRKFVFNRDYDFVNFAACVDSHYNGLLVMSMELVLPIQPTKPNKPTLDQLFAHVNPKALRRIFPNLRQLELAFACGDHEPDSIIRRRYFELVGRIAGNLLHGFKYFGRELEIRMEGIDANELWDAVIDNSIPEECNWPSKGAMDALSDLMDVVVV